MGKVGMSKAWKRPVWESLVWEKSGIGKVVNCKSWVWEKSGFEKCWVWEMCGVGVIPEPYFPNKFTCAYI